MKYCLATLAVVTTLLSTAQKTEAFKVYFCNDVPVRWPNNSYTIRADAKSFPPDSEETRALQDVISRMNANPSNFFFDLTLGDQSVSLNNNENETWFSSDPTLIGNSDGVAYTTSTASCDQLSEADVIFRSNAFTTSTNKNDLIKYGGSYRPFQPTVTHEFGHALGLAHEKGRYNVMGEDYTHIHTNGDSSKSYLGEDASSGAVFLYGLYPNAYPDLSVAHWKYGGINGEYSVHQRTQIYDYAGNPISASIVKGEPVYQVRRGQSVGVELTYENNGVSDLLARIGFYLSTNDFISPNDIFLGSTDLNFNRDVPDTLTYYVTIPNDLTPGRYSIGAVVDLNSAYTEFDEDNNATYITIDVF